MSTQIAVASSVYNLAGDASNQPEFLQTLVMGHVLTPRSSKTSIGDSIKNGYLNGLGVKTRSYFRWAEEHYTYLGLPSGSLSAGNAVPASFVNPHIPVEGGYPNTIGATLIDGSWPMWVEQWFLRNDPDNYDTDNWGADISGGVITITYTNGTVVSFTPTDYVAGAKYIQAYYEEVYDPVDGTITHGTPVELEGDESGGR